ncbi:hypothetical protein KFL_003170140 [Klebsormidium nitens]|uniref:Uncharacterized protein n=1 Tax=Klebsormidium nitens TaxID=105231 RepID=A0A1Y1I7E0_KLENI|nr:hypothetical protein KFL_003170140 [Klebsormidium nitens]|eukprot:GAQ86875.1 hypothetical protein KFL_003170140 [Klebsormidium nitens]
MERTASATNVLVPRPNAQDTLDAAGAQVKTPVHTPNAIEKQLDNWPAFVRAVEESFDECASCNAGSYLEDYQVLGALQLVYDKLAGSGDSRFGRICLFRPSPQDLEAGAREQKTFDRRRNLKRKHFQELARAVYARVLVFRGRRICLFAAGGSFIAKFFMKAPLIRQANNVVTNTIMVGLVGPVAGVVLAVKL